MRKDCAENGKFLGTYAPIGYKKDPQDKHHLIVDEEAAPLARRIFDLRCSGMAYDGIAKLLNAEGVTSPNDRFYQKQGKSNNNRVNHCWCATSVKQIIRNEAYIGNIVNGKRGTLSYKNKKTIAKDPEDWIRVEGVHEPIISKEVWETCIALDEKRYQKRTVPTEKASVLTGMVYCADCNFKMNIARQRRETKTTVREYAYLGCGSYRRSGKAACTPHNIREEILLALVIEDIREKARAVTFDEQRIVQNIINQKSAENDSRLSGYERELKTAQSRMTEIERMMMNLYEDRIEGTVPETVFATLIKKYETQQAELAAAIPELQSKIKNGRECFDNTDMWVKHIRKYTAIEVVDEAILIELVERINVGEQRQIDGVTTCDIKIFYRYVGCVDEALVGMETDYDKAV